MKRGRPASFPDAKKLDIVFMARMGLFTQAEVADLFGISQSYVSRLARGRRRA